ncbi:MAG: O-antigen ligase family protein, partial [Clostridia bacterium]|nr:O-antigen ligase family protein [Clostridia bacterium]
QIAIILTVLSFSPDERIANTCGIVMFAFWGVVVLFKIFDRHLYWDNYVKYLIVVYAVWFLATKVFFSTGLYPSGGVGVVTFLPYCMIFYIIGLNFCDKENSVSNIITAFFIGEILLTLTLLPYLEAISESRYEFLAKNQMGQMLGTGVVFGFFILFQHYKNIVAKIVVLILASVSLMSLLVVGSRTPLIAIGVIAIISFVSKKEKKGSDYAFALAIIIAIAITVSFLGGLDYVLELFELNDTSSSLDINDMTSGRFTLYEQALVEFVQSPLIGIGAAYYVDNFIINILRCGGVLLLILMLPISYGKMYSTYKKTSEIAAHTDNSILVSASKTLLIFYFVVSLMEGYPPMGPGTSTFFMWLLIGIVSGKGGLLSESK